MPKLFIKNRYGQTPNELLIDETISLKAKGLYGFMQAKPDGWKFSVRLMRSQLLEKEQAITTGLQELEKTGYLYRKNYQMKNGKWTTDYYLYAEPTPHEPYTVEPLTVGTDPVKPPNNSKKELSKKDKKEREANYSNSNELPEWSLDEEITKLQSSNNYINKILAFFIVEKKLKFDNKEQLNAYCDRNRKHCKGLKGYKPPEVKKTMNWLEERELQVTPNAVSNNIADVCKI